MNKKKEFYFYISFRFYILLIIFQLLFDKIYIDYGYYIHISNHLFNIVEINVINYKSV